MSVKEWLVKTFEIVPHEILIRKHAECQDGFSVSIQASVGHYCTPKLTIANGNYTHLELGYPNRPEPILKEYDEGDGVFPYVPIEVVEKVIEKHGGIK